jgi:hypothetical protein
MSKISKTMNKISDNRETIPEIYKIMNICPKLIHFSKLMKKF